MKIVLVIRKALGKVKHVCNIKIKFKKFLDKEPLSFMIYNIDLLINVIVDIFVGFGNDVKTYFRKLLWLKKMKKN